MSEERGCLSRTFRIGCVCTLALLLVVGGFVLYGLWTAPAVAPELTAEERATASAKLTTLERSLRAGRPFETAFSEAELTTLAQRYLERKGIEADVSVTLPGDDFQLSIRTTAGQLKRILNLDQLPSFVGLDVRGSLLVHPSVTDNQPYARLESVSLYGVPVPRSLLGSAAEENWFERLDAESAAVIRRIRSLEIHDATLFVTSE
jgi:hypothetical protein